MNLSLLNQIRSVDADNFSMVVEAGCVLEKIQDAAENAGPDTFVQVAIVYEGQNVTIYRGGKEYAAYAVDARQRFGPSSVVLFGKRHLDTTDTSCFRGRIDDARIYDKPLNARQIAGLKPNERSGPAPLAKM